MDVWLKGLKFHGFYVRGVLLEPGAKILRELPLIITEPDQGGLDHPHHIVALQARISGQDLVNERALPHHAHTLLQAERRFMALEVLHDTVGSDGNHDVIRHLSCLLEK